jgi:hypothetical protein
MDGFVSALAYAPDAMRMAGVSQCVHVFDACTAK